MAADRTESRELAARAPRPPGGGGPPDDAAGAPGLGRKVPPPAVAQRIMLFVLVTYVLLGIMSIRVDNPGDNDANIGSYICMAAMLGLQVLHTSYRAPDWPLRVRALTLSAQTVAAFLPFFAFHELWGGMAGFLAGSYLVLLKRPLSWILYTLCCVGMVIFAAAIHETTAWIAYFGIATANLGLIVYALTRLTDLVVLLHAARSELARMAVSQERLRFARDLHDLLGYSLSSITLKSELAYRLTETQPERARLELASILEVSRQALSDLRTVASSYRDMCFGEEVGSVESMLLATGVDVSVEVSLPELPPVLDTVFATVLREGVTNMLRHSKVEHCSITGRLVDGTVRLELVNDGISTACPEAPEGPGSSGLGSLSQRMASVGGQLTAGMRADGKFHLVAQAPLAGAGGDAARAGRANSRRSPDGRAADE
jgi:two-component system sensor histidine kinase DesK